jgi:hypothetical protein
LESGNQVNGVGKHAWFRAEMGHGYGITAFYLAFSSEMLLFWNFGLRWSYLGLGGKFLGGGVSVIPEIILTSLRNQTNNKLPTSLLREGIVEFYVQILLLCHSLYAPFDKVFTSDRLIQQVVKAHETEPPTLSAKRKRYFKTYP